MARIAVALSGGVDSSVAAALLQAAGHDVVGVTLQQWPNEDAEEVERHGGCCSLSAVEDARRVAAVLDIPFYVWNLQEEFGKRVIEPFHTGYMQGQTPNPCLSCNAFVRFDLMLDRVVALGFDALATGHYARIAVHRGEPQLHAARDAAKDQSYVLYHLDREKLRRIRFPLGEMTKGEVREHAREFGLPVANKAESQEICFVPRGRTAEYLTRRLPVSPGEVVDAQGQVLGSHRGAALYTVGQRTGLSDLTRPGPWYVLQVDAGRNRLVAGRREELLVSKLRLKDVSFVDGRHPERLECETRLRYRGQPLTATYEAGTLTLSEPSGSPAPGQAAVFYRGSRVLGGGIVACAF